MADASDIAPRWKPLVVPGPLGPDGSEPFPLAVDTGLGVVVVGGRTAIHVFQVLDRQRLWFSIAGIVRLTGFAIHEGRLHVCDGHILSAWSLADSLTIEGKIFGRCLAAINVLTGQTIDPAAAATSPDPIRGLFGASSTVAPLLSAPAIKINEIGGAPGGMVFVLGSDATIRAHDSALSTTTAFVTAPPITTDGVPVLAIVEDDDATSCKLFYTDAQNRLTGIDASTRTLRSLGQWPAPPSPNAQALPPRGVDGLLWTTGAPDALASFAPAPGSPPVRAWSGGAVTGYDVSPPEKLVLVGAGADRAMLRYENAPALPNAAPPPTDAFVETARMQPSDGPVWTMFWPQSANTPAGSPRLVFEVDRTAGPNGFAYRIFVGQTIMLENPDGAPFYPPVANVLVGGTLSLGTFADAFPKAVEIVVSPVIAGDQAFVVLRSASGDLALADFSLRAIAAQAYPLAAKELTRITGFLNPLKIHVEFTLPPKFYPGSAQQTTFPFFPFNDRMGQLTFDNGQQVTISFDHGGGSFCDGTFAGHSAVTLFDGYSTYRSYPNTLRRDIVNALQFQLIKSPDSPND